MSYTVKNFSHGSLASNLLMGAVSLIMTGTHSLPMSGTFMLVIWDMAVYPNPADDPNTEIVEAQYSGTINVYNIVRAQENTVDVDHSAGAEVALHFTAAMYNHDVLPGYVSDAHVAHSGISVLAGTGMSGGGTIDANVTLNCDIAQYTDGEAEDAIGAMIVDTATIDLTYTDVTPELKADLNSLLKTNYDAAYAHVSSNGSDHSYIDQDVTDDATPQFEGTWYKLDSAVNYECYARNYGWYAYAYDDTVASRGSSVNFRRSRGGSAGSEAIVQDGDWAAKFRFYGYDGSVYHQYGGFIYDLYDVTNGYGKFVFYHQTGSSNYLVEIGPEYTRIGDVDGSDYININAMNGDLSFVGAAGFYPRRIAQSAIPAAGTGATQIDTNELIMWRDTDDGKVYLMFNDTDSGIKSVELT